MLYPVSNYVFIKYLQLEETQHYLALIYNEEIPCKRHTLQLQMVQSGRYDLHKIRYRSQPDFLEDKDNIDQVIRYILSPIFERLDITKLSKPTGNDCMDKRTLEDNKHRYLFDVMLPESIIRHLEQKNGWDHEDAEQFFIDSESRVTQEDLDGLDLEDLIDAQREREKIRQDRVERIKQKQEEEEKREKVENETLWELPDLDSSEEDEASNNMTFNENKIET